MLSYAILVCMCFAVLSEAAPTTEGNLLTILNKTIANCTKEVSQHEKQVTIIKENLFKPALSDTSNEGKETSSGEIDSASDSKKETTKKLEIADKPSTTSSPHKFTTAKSASDEDSTGSEEFTTNITTLADDSDENEATDSTTIQEVESSSSLPTSSKSALDSEPANIENLSVNLADGLFV